MRPMKTIEENARAENMPSDAGVPSTKETLLDAAMVLMLEKGYTATSVDEICRAAGVSKGCFFHYFADKETLARATLERFVAVQSAHLQAAPFQSEADPLNRLFGALDFMLEGVADPHTPKSCLLGNFAQELSATHPGIREVCDQYLVQGAGLYKAMLDEARSVCPQAADVDTQSLADYLVALIQGTLVLYKAGGNLALFERNVAHYKNYVRQLFGR